LYPIATVLLLIDRNTRNSSIETNWNLAKILNWKLNESSLRLNQFDTQTPSTATI